ncbi:MAG: penicillin-binding protein 1C [Bacteroidetes bacterium]|nr:penicillin-binding protein 1C [Bacteroidota bacterium]
MRRRLLIFAKYSAITGVCAFLLFLLLNAIFPLHDDIRYSTVVTDRKGNVLHAFLTPDQKWRMKTELRELSPTLKKTLIYKEDKFFYHHPGVNPIAIVRAVFMNIFHLKRTSGASTITMQVARMMEPRRRTYVSKVIEMFRAFQLEWKYSKEEILQLYFDLVPYGSNIEGVKSASVLFFQKPPQKLSLAEVTALSIVPNRPSSLRMGGHNDVIVLERNKWLKRFEDDGLFPHKDVADALDEPLTVSRHSSPGYAPHLSLRMKREYKDNVQTTLDLNMQMKVEKLVADYSQTQQIKGIKNAAVIVIDNRSHEVVAYVGSADWHSTSDGGQVDGIRAIRQPGSTLKPLLYGLCIDKGLLTPKTVMYDVPININGYTPENFDQKFNGYVTMEYALANSLNIPAVKCLNELGKERLIGKLIETDFKQVKKDQNKLGLSIILGGCGVTLEEMAALYSSFGCGGIYYKPIYIKGDTVSKRLQLLSPSANFMINEILSNPARPELPFSWESSEHTPRIAWKTGTSYGRKDAWSIGFNHDYTVAVWLGNFSGQGVSDLSGANTATPLLFKIFNSIDYNSTQDWYRMPKSCGIRLVCTETGMLPGDRCTNTQMDYFIPGISPNKVCDNYQEIAVDPKEQISYCRYCMPEAGYKKKYYRIVPPEMQRFFEDKRVDYEHVPPHNPDCDRVFRADAPRISYPVNGIEYFIDKNNPEPLQLICQVTNDVKDVYWYVNDKFYRKAPAREKIFVVPSEGNVKLSCTDDKGRNSNIRIKVRYVKI